jgi:hypothetical protein
MKSLSVFVVLTLMMFALPILSFAENPVVLENWGCNISHTNITPPDKAGLRSIVRFFAVLSVKAVPVEITYYWKRSDDAQEQKKVWNITNTALLNKTVEVTDSWELSGTSIGKELWEQGIIQTGKITIETPHVIALP